MVHLIALVALIGVAMPPPSHGRYFGKPDLALTSTMIAAGGGPKEFSSRALFQNLTGVDASRESAALVARFGAENVKEFFITFDAFVDLAIKEAGRQQLALPPPSVLGGRTLAQSLFAAGVMPDRRYDVGYMLEHLLSRPMHVILMREADASPAVGNAKNAEFHIILGAAMNDLHKLYGS